MIRKRGDKWAVTIYDADTKGKQWVGTYATKDEALADKEKLVHHLAKVAAHLEPCMPATSEAILTAVKENKKPENLFPRLG